MKGELLTTYMKLYMELEGLKFPGILIESAYSNLANFLREVPVGIRRIITREAGKSAARSFKNFLRERYKVEEVKVEDVPKVIEAFFRTSGLGEVECELEGERINLNVKDSFMLRVNSDPEIGIGQLIGVVEGFLSELSGKEVIGCVKEQSYIFVIKPKQTAL